MTTPTEAMRQALDALELAKEQLAGDRLELIACHAWPAGSGAIPEHDRAGTQALREYDECLSAADAAITALRDALATEGWRPIETAPKDGSMVLVNDTTKGWTPWVAASYLDGDEWSGWVYDDMTAQDSNPLGPNPTHWLSVPQLPDAPKD